MKNQIITFWNRKGGTGKTTSSIATFDYLTKKGFKTLFIDLDEQANSSLFLGCNKLKPTIKEVFEGQDIHKSIHKVERGFVIPSFVELSAVEINGIDTLYRLLIPIEKEYDFTILDCPPDSYDISLNALYCSDKIVIPTIAHESNLQGLGIFNSIQVPRINNARLNNGLDPLKIEGILLTQPNPRARYTNNYIRAFNDSSLYLNTKVFETKIRQCMALNEAEELRKSIFEYAPESNGAIDYANFVEELLNNN